MFFIITALGHAGLLVQRYIPQLISEASLRYGWALYLINKMLRDPVTVNADQTLVSILLLGLYEVPSSILC